MNKSKSTILIVDDQPLNIYALEAVLKAKDRVLLKANSGNEALQIVLHNHVDLIILDVQMPEMDGFEVAQVLKYNKRTRDIPIIFATAVNKDEKFVLKGYAEGAIDYLYKPLNNHIVNAKVNVLLKLQKQKAELIAKNTALERSALLINNSADIIGIMDIKGWKIEEVNEAFTSVLGYSKLEVRELTLPMILLPGSLDSMNAVKKNGSKTGDFETAVYAKNRAIKWLHWKVVVMEGKWLFNARDITEIKEVEENRNYLATVVRQSKDAIYIHDAEGKIITWNQGAENIYGYDEREALQMYIWSLVPIYSRKETEDLIISVINGEKIHGLPCLRINKYGRVIDVLCSAELIDSQGAEKKIVITERNVTDQKIAETKLRESEARFRNLFENAPFPMWVYDRNNLNIIEVNHTASLIYGYTKEAFLKMKVTDLHIEQEREKVIDTVKSRKNIFSSSRGWKHIHQNGSLTDVEITSHLLEYKGSNACLVIAKDITEELLVEEKIREINEELESRVEEKTMQLIHANKNLEKRAHELEASNIELERFAFVASHDLQEPLRMVTSFLSLLEEESFSSLTPEAQEYIRFAVDGAERMKRLINALLEYSRAGSNKDDVSDIDCNLMINDVLSLIDYSIKEKSAQIVVHNLPLIRGAESQIQQLFQNLIINALKYNNSHPPEIEIGCTEEKELWKFFIKDNGIGIPKQYAEKIFIIFQRLHDKSEYSGTGIGLAICKKIAERHGGRIWVESVPGEGSVFYFTISKSYEEAL